MVNLTKTLGHFPETRLRRTRAQSFSRTMTAEASLEARNLIQPIFVTDGKNILDPIEGLDGMFRHSIDHLAKRAKDIHALGIPAIVLFPHIDKTRKDDDGREALSPDNLICRAIAEIKNAVPDLGVITDVALDPYTTHGHDGVIRNKAIDNDETVSILREQAVISANAGADIIAPSDMMDGRVGAIRRALDEAGHQNVMIMSYAAKYASALYAPFRNAIGVDKVKIIKDKTSYQLNPANSDEAMREIALDIDEGADLIIIKPGLPYLDVIGRAVHTFNIPIFAYQVSGEYAMIKAMPASDAQQSQALMMETLLAFKRAGCQGILTYFAIEAAQALNKNR